MPDELEKILAEGKDTQPPASEATPQEAKPEVDEVQKKREELDNLNKAVAEAQSELRETRKKKKELASAPTTDEELPEIDFKDPSAKAWDQHVDRKVNPMSEEMEREKEEVRTFALQRFLQDKPALAKDPEQLKELVTIYERIRTATERTQEGVLIDLQKAYAATHADELLAAARQNRIESAEADIIASDIAVTRGATAYSQPKVPKRKLSSEEQKIVDRWNDSLERLGYDTKDLS